MHATEGEFSACNVLTAMCSMLSEEVSMHACSLSQPMSHCELSQLRSIASVWVYRNKTACTSAITCWRLRQILAL